METPWLGCTVCSTNPVKTKGMKRHIRSKMHQMEMKKIFGKDQFTGCGFPMIALMAPRIQKELTQPVIGVSLLTLCFSPDTAIFFYLCHVCEEKCLPRSLCRHLSSSDHCSNYFTYTNPNVMSFSWTPSQDMSVVLWKEVREEAGKAESRQLQMLDLTKSLLENLESLTYSEVIRCLCENDKLRKLMEAVQLKRTMIQAYHRDPNREHPLLGMQHVVECVGPAERRHYLCTLCKLTLSTHMIIKHVLSFDHIYCYFKEYHPSTLLSKESYSMYSPPSLSTMISNLAKQTEEIHGSASTDMKQIQLELAEFMSVDFTCYSKALDALEPIRKTRKESSLVIVPIPGKKLGVSPSESLGDSWPLPVKISCQDCDVDLFHISGYLKHLGSWHHGQALEKMFGRAERSDGYKPKGTIPYMQSYTHLQDCRRRTQPAVGVSLLVVCVCSEVKVEPISICFACSECFLESSAVKHLTSHKHMVHTLLYLDPWKLPLGWENVEDVGHLWSLAWTEKREKEAHQMTMKILDLPYWVFQQLFPPCYTTVMMTLRKHYTPLRRGVPKCETFSKDKVNGKFPLLGRHFMVMHYICDRVHQPTEVGFLCILCQRRLINKEFYIHVFSQEHITAFLKSFHPGSVNPGMDSETLLDLAKQAGSDHTTLNVQEIQLDRSIWEPCSYQQAYNLLTNIKHKQGRGKLLPLITAKKKLVPRVTLTTTDKDGSMERSEKAGGGANPTNEPESRVKEEDMKSPTQSGNRSVKACAEETQSSQTCPALKEEMTEEPLVARLQEGESRGTAAEADIKPGQSVRDRGLSALIECCCDGRCPIYLCQCCSVKIQEKEVIRHVTRAQHQKMYLVGFKPLPRPPGMKKGMKFSDFASLLEKDMGYGEAQVVDLDDETYDKVLHQNFDMAIQTVKGVQTQGSVPLSTLNSAPPEATPNAPPEATPDAPPEATPDAPPEATPDAPPEATPDAPPEATPDAPPEATPDAPPEATPDAPPEATPDAPPVATPDTLSEATPDTLSEATPDAPSEATPDAPSEATPDAPSEATPDAPSEATPDAPSEAIPDALSEATPDALSEATPDALSEATPDAPSDATPDALSEATPDAPSDATPDALSEATPDALSEATPDALSEATPDAPSDATPDALSEATPDAPSDATPDALSEATPDAPSDATPDALSEATPDAPSDATPDALSEATPDAPSDATPDALSEATPDAPSEATPNTPSEATPDALSEATPVDSMSSPQTKCEDAAFQDNYQVVDMEVDGDLEDGTVTSSNFRNGRIAASTAQTNSCTNPTISGEAGYTCAASSTTAGATTAKFTNSNSRNSTAEMSTAHHNNDTATSPSRRETSSTCGAFTPSSSAVTAKLTAASLTTSVSTALFTSASETTNSKTAKRSSATASTTKPSRVNPYTSATTNKPSRVNPCTSASTTKPSRVNPCTSASTTKPSRVNPYTSASTTKPSRVNPCTSASTTKPSRVNPYTSATTTKPSGVNPCTSASTTKPSRVNPCTSASTTKPSRVNPYTSATTNPSADSVDSAASSEVIMTHRANTEPSCLSGVLEFSSQLMQSSECSAKPSVKCADSESSEKSSRVKKPVGLNANVPNNPTSATHSDSVVKIGVSYLIEVTCGEKRQVYCQLCACRMRNSGHLISDTHKLNYVKKKYPGFPTHPSDIKSKLDPTVTHLAVIEKGLGTARPQSVKVEMDFYKQLKTLPGGLAIGRVTEKLKQNGGVRSSTSDPREVWTPDLSSPFDASSPDDEMLVWQNDTAGLSPEIQSEPESRHEVQKPHGTTPDEGSVLKEDRDLDSTLSLSASKSTKTLTEASASSDSHEERNHEDRPDPGSLVTQRVPEDSEKTSVKYSDTAELFSAEPAKTDRPSCSQKAKPGPGQSACSLRAELQSAPQKPRTAVGASPGCSNLSTYLSVKRSDPNKILGLKSIWECRGITQSTFFLCESCSERLFTTDICQHIESDSHHRNYMVRTFRDVPWWKVEDLPLQDRLGLFREAAEQVAVWEHSVQIDAKCTLLPPKDFEYVKTAPFSEALKFLRDYEKEETAESRIFPPISTLQVEGGRQEKEKGLMDDVNQSKVSGLNTCTEASSVLAPSPGPGPGQSPEEESEIPQEPQVIGQNQTPKPTEEHAEPSSSPLPKTSPHPPSAGDKSPVMRVRPAETSVQTQSAPPGSAPPGSAPPGSAPPQSAPPQSAPPQSAPPGSAPPRSAPPRSAPPQLAVSPSPLSPEEKSSGPGSHGPGLSRRGITLDDLIALVNEKRSEKKVSSANSPLVRGSKIKREQEFKGTMPEKRLRTGPRAQLDKSADGPDLPPDPSSGLRDHQDQERVDVQSMNPSKPGPSGETSKHNPEQPANLEPSSWEVSQLPISPIITARPNSSKHYKTRSYAEVNRQATQNCPTAPSVSHAHTQVVSAGHAHTSQDGYSCYPPPAAVGGFTTPAYGTAYTHSLYQDASMGSQGSGNLSSQALQHSTGPAPAGWESLHMQPQQTLLQQQLVHQQMLLQQQPNLQLMHQQLIQQQYMWSSAGPGYYPPPANSQIITQGSTNSSWFFTVAPDIRNSTPQVNQENFSLPK